MQRVRAPTLPVHRCDRRRGGKPQATDMAGCGTADVQERRRECSPGRNPATQAGIGEYKKQEALTKRPSDGFQITTIENKGSNTRWGNCITSIQVFISLVYYNAVL